MLNELITSMRPQQWDKDLILFVSIIFSLNILIVEMRGCFGYCGALCCRNNN